jgi:hypothetical protein
VCVLLIPDSPRLSPFGSQILFISPPSPVLPVNFGICPFFFVRLPSFLGGENKQGDLGDVSREHVRDGDCSGSEDS